MNREKIKTLDADKLRKQEHNYELYETDTGFLVSPIEKGRPLVFANISPNGYWSVGDYNPIMMYDFFKLSERVVDTLYETWSSPVFNPQGDGYRKARDTGHEAYEEYLKKANKYGFIYQWAKTTTKKTLAKKMCDIWKRKNEELVPEDVRILHRKIFSTSCGRGNISTLSTILENKERYGYLIKDLLNYRGARALMLSTREEEFLKGDWKSAFGDITNGSMRKTLMNMPGVPYFLATSFMEGECVLPEPALTRIRFMSYAYIAFRCARKWEEVSKVILCSSDDDIRKAIRMVWEYAKEPQKSGFRSTRAISNALRFIFDYDDEIGDWDIIGLCKRSIVYHKELANRRRENEIAILKRYNATLEEKTALPPIALPNTPNVTFLDTCKAIIDEGSRMGHCISGYANEALKGKCYLFHVDYEGEMASVEVAPGGFVRQSQGVQNKQNKASVYGQKVLGKWAQRFPKQENLAPYM